MCTKEVKVVKDEIGGMPTTKTRTAKLEEPIRIVQVASLDPDAKDLEMTAQAPLSTTANPELRVEELIQQVRHLFKEGKITVHSVMSTWAGSPFGAVEAFKMADTDEDEIETKFSCVVFDVMDILGNLQKEDIWGFWKEGKKDDALKNLIPLAKETSQLSRKLNRISATLNAYAQELQYTLHIFQSGLEQNNKVDANGNLVKKPLKLNAPKGRNCYKFRRAMRHAWYSISGAPHQKKLLALQDKDKNRDKKDVENDLDLKHAEKLEGEHAQNEESVSSSARQSQQPHIQLLHVRPEIHTPNRNKSDTMRFNNVCNCQNCHCAGHCGRQYQYQRRPRIVPPPLTLEQLTFHNPYCHQNPHHYPEHEWQGQGHDQNQCQDQREERNEYQNHDHHQVEICQGQQGPMENDRNQDKDLSKGQCPDQGQSQDQPSGVKIEEVTEVTEVNQKAEMDVTKVTEVQKDKEANEFKEIEEVKDENLENVNEVTVTGVEEVSSMDEIVEVNEVTHFKPQEKEDIFDTEEDPTIAEQSEQIAELELNIDQDICISQDRIQTQDQIQNDFTTTAKENEFNEDENKLDSDINVITDTILNLEDEIESLQIQEIPQQPQTEKPNNIALSKNKNLNSHSNSPPNPNLKIEPVSKTPKDVTIIIEKEGISSGNDDTISSRPMSRMGSQGCKRVQNLVSEMDSEPFELQTPSEQFQDQENEPESKSSYDNGFVLSRKNRIRDTDSHHSQDQDQDHDQRPLDETISAISEEETFLSRGDRDRDQEGNNEADFVLDLDLANENDSDVNDDQDQDQDYQDHQDLDFDLELELDLDLELELNDLEMDQTHEDTGSGVDTRILDQNLQDENNVEGDLVMKGDATTISSTTIIPAIDLDACEDADADEVPLVKETPSKPAKSYSISNTADARLEDAQESQPNILVETSLLTIGNERIKPEHGAFFEICPLNSNPEGSTTANEQEGEKYTTLPTFGNSGEFTPGIMYCHSKYDDSGHEYGVGCQQHQEQYENLSQSQKYEHNDNTYNKKLDDGSNLDPPRSVRIALEATTISETQTNKDLERPTSTSALFWNKNKNHKSSTNPNHNLDMDFDPDEQSDLRGKEVVVVRSAVSHFAESEFGVMDVEDLDWLNKIKDLGQTGHVCADEIELAEKLKRQSIFMNCIKYRADEMFKDVRGILETVREAERKWVDPWARVGCKSHGGEKGHGGHEGKYAGEADINQNESCYLELSHLVQLIHSYCSQLVSMSFPSAERATKKFAQNSNSCKNSNTLTVSAPKETKKFSESQREAIAEHLQNLTSEVAACHKSFKRFARMVAIDTKFLKELCLSFPPEKVPDFRKLQGRLGRGNCYCQGQYEGQGQPQGQGQSQGQAQGQDQNQCQGQGHNCEQKFDEVTNLNLNPQHCSCKSQDLPMSEFNLELNFQEIFS